MSLLYKSTFSPLLNDLSLSLEVPTVFIYLRLTLAAFIYAGNIAKGRQQHLAAYIWIKI